MNFISHPLKTKFIVISFKFKIRDILSNFISYAVKTKFLLFFKFSVFCSLLYLLYFWVGLSLFFFPAELSFGDYVFGFMVAGIVNAGILFVFLPPSIYLKWLGITLQLISSIIYLQFLGPNSWGLSLLGILTNCIGAIILWGKGVTNGKKPY